MPCKGSLQRRHLLSASWAQGLAALRGSKFKRALWMNLKSANAVNFPSLRKALDSLHLETSKNVFPWFLQFSRNFSNLNPLLAFRIELATSDLLSAFKVWELNKREMESCSIFHSRPRELEALRACDQIQLGREGGLGTSSPER